MQNIENKLWDIVFKCNTRIATPKETVRAILTLIKKHERAMLPKERVLNKDNPQYVLGWNACLGVILARLKEVEK